MSETMMDGGEASSDWGEALAEQQAGSAQSSSPQLSSPQSSSQLAAPPPPGFQKFAAGEGGAGAQHDIDMILDIPVHLSVELGRTRIPIKQILQLAQGSVI